jgi:hypothetical protein
VLFAWQELYLQKVRYCILENIVNLICNGSTEFTPEVLIGLLVFCMTLECIGSIAYSILSVGKR